MQHYYEQFKKFTYGRSERVLQGVQLTFCRRDSFHTIKKKRLTAGTDQVQHNGMNRCG